MALKSINVNELEKLFIEFELKKALEALSDGNTIHTFNQLKKVDTTNYNLVLTLDELLKVIEKIKRQSFFVLTQKRLG